MDLTKLTTEKRNPRTMKLDALSFREILTIMNEEDQLVPQAIQSVIPLIEQGINIIVERFNRGGRLIYMGAGTSGRLGVLDAAECPPTFGTDPGMVIGLIAGGKEAFTEAIEGAEDSEQLGQDDLIQLQLTENDVVVGLAASGRTPYVIGGLRYANETGAYTMAISCNKGSAIGKEAKLPIEAEAGPEVLTGSTRLKAGTTQKLILNMLSTVSMIGMGKVYENLMVDVKRSNEKLERRALNIIKEATGVNDEVAKTALKESHGQVKVAITMILLNVDQSSAVKALSEANGHIRQTLPKIKER
ncbi:N-acetylmuramic acid 6-phosphate etherase 2 [Halolactibacillus miurensis]|uniref:N-acetylmuramic acid 6-phosphate etherase n=1 Tax=Halolactibacillus miurensis TaxID=306541 RepID=A0A1I6SBM9_9BACI|nr:MULTISPECIES: N-acetylmuramic acid 6-phosphate etherase [Halolactibacillus]GEM03990.1 N-acetylmuramic acid 6-phosphate etherase 2 [Halolactibacillus miurensis]SFS74323.1 N-acetylmuramic acid 6-phosphate etherase [Halolactibacillus miurensis]